jgi:L-fuconate dehydratase
MNSHADQQIARLTVRDIRFPTSESLDGSDAMHTDPDYSAAYVTLSLSGSSVEGNGIAFTLGSGTEIVVAAVRALEHLVVGRTLQQITDDFAGFWRELTSESQLRWLGPEKGVIHLATAAIVNALWDLWAKLEHKPLWKLLVDLPPERLVSCIDFRYLTDALDPSEALAILRAGKEGAAEREQVVRERGYAAYTTSAGWLGYSDEKIQRLCKEAIAQGFRHVKLKVGANLEDDLRRCAIVREAIGPDRFLMVDANQRWDVGEAISVMQQLAQFDPLWIEEPTSPDDVLGHKKIRDAIAPVGVATGEACQNRVIFKQLLELGAIQFCQIDSCRVGGVNELLGILLLAHKFGVPVCPHAGGVGLCEHVQHLSVFDYVAISQTMEGRVIEFVDHLHEHFEDPVVVENGRYKTPSVPGYSITMKPESLSRFEFPGGSEWKERRTRMRH